MDKKIEKKTWTWQRITIGIVVISAIAWLGTRLYKDSGKSKLNVQTERIQMDTVRRGVFQEFIPVTGTVQPIREVYLDAIEGGRVEEKFTEDGATVRAGQAILRLSNQDLQLNYLNQEANIVNQINTIRNTSLLMEQQSLNLKELALDVDNQLDLYSKRNARNKSLYADKVISQVEFEETQDQFTHLNRRKKLLRTTIEKDSMFHVMQQRQMDNSLDLMQRNLTISKLSLDALTVRAPIAGQLSSLDVEVGQLISRGSRIAQIDDLSNFKIRARIDEFYVSRIFIDQEGSFDFAGKSYRLRIKKIYPQVANGAFEADLHFVGEAPAAIKRGQTLSIKLELSAEEQALLLARGGFYQSTGGNWAYVIDPATGRAYKREMKVGRQNPNYYEVLEGLKSGDVVITSSYENFGDKDELVLK